MSTSGAPAPARPPGARRVRGPVLFLGLVAVILAIIIPTVFVPTVLFPPAEPRLDDHGQLPPFALTDHTGAELTRASLEGQVTIVNFIFTRCDTICPVTSMKMRTVQEKTADLAGRIKLLSISVDPAHDTVPVLAAYAARFGADPGRWRFVRGDIAAVRDLVERGLAIGFDDLGGTTASGAPNITHSGHFVLLDQRAHIRGYYDSDDWPRIERLMKHARFLVRRPPGPPPGS
ncbi:MAG: SCO family protein [Kofleriaceae bacterium]|nr:SCO family protein [Kofleriaceae bacterium]MCL4222919.1 SCO family protein [Myxococcales bacterium]